MLLEELLQKGKEFEQNNEIVQKIEEGKRQLELFLTKYPFKEKPELIDSLTPEKIYSPGSEDYFFLWIEHKTRSLGAISTYGGITYPNAIEKIDQFKQLLKILVDKNKKIWEKIDHECDIKGFGGDKLITKKILYCYFSNDVLPIFKTEHLEHFCKKLSLDYERESSSKYGRPYENLTDGEKYELLNDIVLNFKKQKFPSWENPLFTRFLYENLKPEKMLEKEASKPLHRLGLLFEPQSEQEVVYLFSILHRELGFPYIIKFQEAFPDVSVLDEDRKQRKVEIEKFASDFIAHGHPTEECDFIVCWENDLTEIPENFPKLIPLKDYISTFDAG
ncbi:MAG: hypothetical protein ABC585_00170 [Candidatus Methanosuratincola petrocarbonis]